LAKYLGRVQAKRHRLTPVPFSFLNEKRINAKVAEDAEGMV
jgi:hypothetical protein